MGSLWAQRKQDVSRRALPYPFARRLLTSRFPRTSLRHHNSDRVPLDSVQYALSMLRDGQPLPLRVYATRRTSLRSCCANVEEFFCL